MLKRLFLLAISLIISGRLAAAEPLPLSAFLDPPQIRLPKLSPDGHTVAMIGVRDGDDFLAEINLTTMKASPVCTFPHGKLLNYWWKESGQLLFLNQEVNGSPYFQGYDPGKKKAIEVNVVHNSGVMVNPLPQDPDHLIIATDTENGVDLRRLDLRTGQSTLLEKYSERIFNWFTDRNGQPMAAYGRDNETWFMLTRTAPGVEWKRTDLSKKRLPDFLPIAVYSDQRRILGIDYQTSNIARATLLDPATGQQEPIFQPTEADPNEVLVWGDDITHARAIGYETDQPQFHYLEEKDKKLAEWINHALPDTTNNIVSMSKDEAVFVIRTYSDTEPTAYYVLDRRTGRMLPLGSSKPALVNTKMARSQYFTYESSDGLQLHGRILLPAQGPAHPPLIVIVGPELNGPRWYKGFISFEQLLASRGYAVARFDYRGVEGYGRILLEAGDQQITTGMPKDIAAGVQWLETKGLVDQSRVALFGFYQGGIVALEALAQYPDLFASWINMNTPMARGYLGSEDMVFGRYEDSEKKIRLGGGRSALKYVDSIIPADLLAQVHVPSFHYYARQPYDNSTVLDGDKAEAYFSRQKMPFVFMKAPPVHSGLHSPTDPEGKGDENPELKRRSEELRIYTQMLEFLGKYLHPHS